jgi:DnaJ-class molecular chaperone
MAASPYDELGVARTAADDEIRHAYRQLARTYHPDVNPGDRAAEDRFKRITAAYEVLADPGRRKAFDEFGARSLESGFDPARARARKRKRRSPPQRGAPDIDVEELFGGRRARRRQTTPASAATDVHAMVDMELRQAIKGGEVTLEVPGRGPVSVRIPPGADSGSIIRLRGKGAPGPDGDAGDLIIETRIAAHPFVRREGLHLYLRVPVTIGEAYLGATIDIPTFDGPVSVRIPARSQPGKKLRLRGKGVPRKGKTGDLYLELEVRLPDREDAELEEALRRADGAYGRPVRRDLVL